MSGSDSAVLSIFNTWIMDAATEFDSKDGMCVVSRLGPIARGPKPMIVSKTPSKEAFNGVKCDFMMDVNMFACLVVLGRQIRLQ